MFAQVSGGNRRARVARESFWEDARTPHRLLYRLAKVD